MPSRQVDTHPVGKAWPGMERLPRGPPLRGAVLPTQARHGTERACDGCPRYQESAVPAAIGNATDELRAARWERRIKLSSASRR